MIWESVPGSGLVHETQWKVKEHLKLGELLESDRDSKEAFSEYLKAQSLSKGVTDPAFLLEAQYHVAQWYVRDGQYEQAYESLKPALDRVEAKRQSVSGGTLKASYFAVERKCYELGVNLRMQQFESDPGGGGDALALELSERSRARGLLDELNTKGRVAGRRGEHAQISLMRSNFEVNRAFDHRLKLLVEGGTSRDLELSAAVLTQALANLELTEQDLDSITNQSPEPATTMTAAEIEQSSLSSRATFFEYALGDERSYLWVIFDGRRQSYVLPSRQQLERYG